MILPQSELFYRTEDGFIGGECGPFIFWCKRISLLEKQSKEDANYDKQILSKDSTQTFWQRKRFWTNSSEAFEG